MRTMNFLLVILLLSSITLSAQNKKIQKDPCDEKAHTVTGIVDTEMKVKDIIERIGEIEKKDGALYFKSEERMEEVVGALSFLSEKELDTWEESIKFSSQRRFYNKKKKSDDVDDEQLDKKRINLSYVETVFNAEGIVYVGELKIVHEGSRKFNAYNAKNKMISLNKYNKKSNIIPCNNCRQGKFQHCDQYFFNGNYKVVGTKWNEGYGFYASVGFRTKYYSKNHKGHWKDASASMLGANLDQWHHVQICEGYSGANNYSSIRKEGHNAQHHVEKVIKWRMFASNYCVPHFGRVHHWKDNDYNNDAHCEPSGW